MQFKSFKSDFSQLAAIGLSLLLAGMAGSAFAFKGAQYAKEAKLSLDQARTVALKVEAGKIVDEELEKEAGGSGLRYSFAIAKGKVTKEVGVDARTGRVLENRRERVCAD